MTAEKIAPIVDAATCIPIFDGADGLEVVVVQRASTMRFMPNAFAFPGGKVSPDDQAIPTRFHAAAVRETAEETALEVDASALLSWACWTTPPYEPKRFRTEFFLATPSNSTIHVDGSETVAYLRQSPRVLLRRCLREHELILPPPVLVTLLELSRHHTSADACRAAKQRNPGRLATERYDVLPARVETSLRCGELATLTRDGERWVLPPSDWPEFLR